MSDYLARTDSFMARLDAEVYRVGGSVRDELLGKRIKDADYMVRGKTLIELGSMLLELKPKGLKPLKLRDGRQAGWRVHEPGLGLIEIVLPRTEISTGPGHRDFEIIVAPDLGLIDDSKRRDFTFNALYKPIREQVLDTDGIIDPTGCGLYDLQHRIIRTTHSDSFRDDPLRTLRALRFVSVLGYDLAASTREEMILYADAVTGLTGKGTSGTVLEEFNRLLMGQNPAEALRLARDTGVLHVAMPELAPMLGFDQSSRYHDLTTDEHTFAALKTASHVDAPLRVRWALLFHDAGKPEAAWVGEDGRKHYYTPDDKTWRKVCLMEGLIHQGESSLPQPPLDHEEVSERLWNEAGVRLNIPKKLRAEVATLIRHHMVKVEGKVKGSQVRRDRVKFGDELLRDLYMHRLCDLSGKGKPNMKHINHVGGLEVERQKAVHANVPSSLKDLQISGRDLIKLGINGRDIGRVLNAVLDEVVCQPKDQTLSREWQLERAKALA